MSHRLAISTVSMGWHQTHTLESKITAAKAAGFEGIELFITDFNAFRDRLGKSSLAAAKEIRALCAKAGLEILCFGSFDNFEGDPTTPLENRLEKASEWLDLVHELGTNVIQVPSNDDRRAMCDERLIVDELRALADLGLQRQPPKVDRPNFGLCLDTYHVLARLWADPTDSSGLRPGGTAALRDSIQRFLDVCPRDKIVYVQLSDAERMSPPIWPGHPAYHEDKYGVHSWCTYGRLFPQEDEQGAYLPMEDITHAWLVRKGWKGWVSLEVFHRDMKMEERDPEYWARRGKASWESLKTSLGI
ncbi:uncharacterized protein PV06_05002 [Exophiala oligosperma]|uniref:Xylose isomerase-like TIM barrel domain-containing protein n=1 Tax=Exophiala oligosperma TaxID=215243 RepID=A0A0D2AVZ8_9EURO|nr:uncharacterized protein PV06_05002 [Exophiala oligosperma]KIW43956.1 hypothetical protein PV06_05002 [Exophiala oligosperma]